MAPVIPPWAWEVLRDPAGGGRLQLSGDRVLTSDGREAARIDSGVVRFAVTGGDPNIAAYRASGGAHFFERRTVPFSMSALDTPLYHGLLADFRPAATDGLVVDVGGGDGRNARPWLDWGFHRVVVVDAAGAALARFHARLAAEDESLLQRVLLIEGDARALPLADGCASQVMAIESLYYLNEDWETGLAQCARMLAPGGRLLLSERDWEGNLLVRLLYAGVGAMLAVAGGRDVWDGDGPASLRTRCFTEAELRQGVAAAGLTVVECRGTPLLSAILGWMNLQGLLPSDSHDSLPELSAVLRRLTIEGHQRRCHVVVAERA